MGWTFGPGGLQQTESARPQVQVWRDRVTLLHFTEINSAKNFKIRFLPGLDVGHGAPNNHYSCSVSECLSCFKQSERSPAAVVL